MKSCLLATVVVLWSILLSVPLKAQIIRLKKLTDLVSPDSVAIGKKAVDFDISDRNEGHTALSSLQGRYLLLNFWATSINASMYQIPYWERARKKFTKKNIDFIRISVDTDKSSWARYFDTHHLTGFQFHADPYKAPLSYYLLKARTIKGKPVLSYRLPHYILIDPRGVILDNDILVKPSDTVGFDEFIQKLP